MKEEKEEEEERERGGGGRGGGTEIYEYTNAIRRKRVNL